MTKQNKNSTQSFGEHLRELRNRLFWCLLVLGIGMCVGWAFHTQVIEFLRHPINEKLYFTTPTGGFEFVMSVSLFVGVVIATPVLIYQLMQFIRPVSEKISLGRVFRFVIASILLAVAGVSFGYMVSLPAALHFLLDFGNSQVSALINVNDYMNFVMTYLACFALIFQLPLILLFINRITPLPPRKLMRFQRIVIALSFISAAILTPTPDPINQIIMALPMIVLYQIALVCVLISNKLRGVKHEKPQTLPASESKSTSEPQPEVPIEEIVPEFEPVMTAEKIRPSADQAGATTYAVADTALPKPLSLPNIKAPTHAMRTIDLSKISKRPGRKQPASRLFHNSNLPARRFDIGSLS